MKNTIRVLIINNACIKKKKKTVFSNYTNLVVTRESDRLNYDKTDPA